MKLSPDNPLLTAYILGELEAKDAVEIERAILNDPELLLEIQSVQEFRKNLENHLTLAPETLLPEQQQKILDLAWEGDQSTSTRWLSSVSEILKTWFIPASAAAILTLTTVILIRIPSEQNPIAANTPSLDATEITSPTAIEPIPPKFDARTSGNTADYPILNLPVQIAKSSFELISKSIRDEKKLPPREAVRLEEILNHFPLRLNGISAIARSGNNSWHPDQRDSGMSTYVATLTTEMLPCPWKPSATLLLISLRGNLQSDCEVKLAFHANAENVSRYKLLGFSTNNRKLEEKIADQLLAKSSTTFALEIESLKRDADFGSLEWTTNDRAAPSIRLIQKSATEPSDDARFAALICTYSQWLTGEQAGVIDPPMVSALAREIMSANLPKDRSDFLQLIQQSFSHSR